jgi:hypothetical protein
MDQSAQIFLPSFQHGKWYRSRDTVTLNDGALLGLIPDIAVLAQVRMSLVPDPHPLSHSDIKAILADAMALFACGSLTIGDDTETFSDFETRLQAIQGIPSSLVQHWTRQLVGIVDDLLASAPEQNDGAMLISLPSNTFLCLESVFQALWNGYRVFIRPSQREPYSALRLVAALLAAGLPPTSISLCPLTRNSVANLLPYFAKVLLFGGDGLLPLVQSLGAAGVNITVKGAGCSVAIVDDDWTNATVASVARLVARSAGRLCINVRWVVVPTRVNSFAQALGDMLALSAMPDHDPELMTLLTRDPNATNSLRQSLFDGLHAGDAIITGAHPPQLDRGNRIPPVVIHARRADGHPLLKAEPGFPFAMVTQGQSQDLTSTFAHAQFAFQARADGTVGSIRHDGVDALEVCHA